MKSPPLLEAVLADLIHPRMLVRHSMERMQELEELVRTYGGLAVVKRYQKRFTPHPRTFLGPGKIENLGKEGKALGARLLVVNDILKPRQAYLIGEALRPHGMEVWDRIDLILKIFSKHARTSEAKLEIELASLRHMGPRIFGMGMELSRQGGGIGTTGIGETNIEIMRRHLRERERHIRSRLAKCERVRQGHRAGRRRADLRTVALIGYTNAGKTSLLNALTGRREYAADELFATLDTRVGQLYLPGKQRIALLSDTIGFIKHLPTELIDAFASTLSEAVEADLLLHVVDGSDAHAGAHVQVADEILERLGVAETPRIMVVNKADGMGPMPAALTRVLTGRPRVLVSAASGQGIDELTGRIESVL